ncbi:MAG: hypothetical protein F4093_10425 [Gammaproteobacteria bacterium]|nr:hypothetical protein [Gammaproteobacteria bacterium]
MKTIISANLREDLAVRFRDSGVLMVFWFPENGGVKQERSPARRSGVSVWIGLADSASGQGSERQWDIQHGPDTWFNWGKSL